jgi:chaperonin GroEL
MQDIALSLGATYYSEKTGDDLSLIQEADLGFAKKIIVGRNSTVVVKDAENPNQKEINERVEQLWKQHKSATKKADKVFLESRIASLVGGIGVIYAGGATDIEQKEKFDRIEDAVCAVKAALESGVLPGGGIALKHYGMSVCGMGYENEEQAAARFILEEALYSPFKQICKNAGLDWKEVDKKDRSNQKVNMVQMSVPKNGFNVKTKEHGDMMEMGIVDPAKVTTSALINATSVALTICSTNAIVTLARTYESE